MMKYYFFRFVQWLLKKTLSERSYQSKAIIRSYTANSSVVAFVVPDLLPELIEAGNLTPKLELKVFILTLQNNHKQYKFWV